MSYNPAIFYVHFRAFEQSMAVRSPKGAQMSESEFPSFNLDPELVKIAEERGLLKGVVVHSKAGQAFTAYMLPVHVNIEVSVAGGEKMTGYVFVMLVQSGNEVSVIRAADLASQGYRAADTGEEGVVLCDKLPILTLDMLERMSYSA